MSTPNINCILQAVLSAQNNLISPPPLIANYDFGNPTFGATAMFFDPFFQVGTGVVVAALPATTIYGLLVQNLSLSASVTLTYLPTGLGNQSLLLGPAGATNPGDSFIYWAPSKPSGTAGGITFVQFQASAVNTPVMLLMVG